MRLRARIGVLRMSDVHDVGRRREGSKLTGKMLLSKRQGGQAGLLQRDEVTLSVLVYSTDEPMRSDLMFCWA